MNENQLPPVHEPVLRTANDSLMFCTDALQKSFVALQKLAAINDSTFSQSVSKMAEMEEAIVTVSAKHFLTMLIIFFIGGLIWAGLIWLLKKYRDHMINVLNSEKAYVSIVKSLEKKVHFHDPETELKYQELKILQNNQGILFKFKIWQIATFVGVFHVFMVWVLW
jgi:hypothetical protein